MPIIAAPPDLFQNIGVRKVDDHPTRIRITPVTVKKMAHRPYSEAPNPDRSNKNPFPWPGFDSHRSLLEAQY